VCVCVVSTRNNIIGRNITLNVENHCFGGGEGGDGKV